MRVVIAMPMEEELQNKIFEGLKKFPWLKESHLTFVHVFKQENYPYMIPPMIYPDQNQMIEIKKTIEEILSGVGKHVVAREKDFLCLFHEGPKEGLVQYLQERDIDLCIGFAKEKTGFVGYFQSSFTEFLIKHSPIPVLILR